MLCTVRLLTLILVVNFEVRSWETTVNIIRLHYRASPFRFLMIVKYTYIYIYIQFRHLLKLLPIIAFFHVNVMITKRMIEKRRD